MDLDITTPTVQTTTKSTTTTAAAITSTTTSVDAVFEEANDVQDIIGNRDGNTDTRKTNDDASSYAVVTTTESSAKPNVTKTTAPLRHDNDGSKLVYTTNNRSGGVKVGEGAAGDDGGVKVVLSTLPVPSDEEGVSDPSSTFPQSKQEMKSVATNGNNNAAVGSPPAPPSVHHESSSIQSSDDVWENTVSSSYDYNDINHHEAPAPAPHQHINYQTTYAPIHHSPHHCPPLVTRTLSWPPTAHGSMAQLACPLGTRGMAHWACGGPSTDLPVWLTPQPDLSECQSYWIDKIILELRKSDSIVTIAQDMVDYVRVNKLYGGDIIAIIKAMTIITEKLDFQVGFALIVFKAYY